MSEIIVTSKETLVVIVDEPERKDGVFRKPAWSGSLECKCQDWTMDQIEAHIGKPEYVFKVFKVTQYGTIENLTDRVLEFMEERV